MTYEGSFLDGELEGEGQAIFTSGDTYTGSFSKSRFHGYGHYKYVEGLEVTQH